MSTGLKILPEPPRWNALLGFDFDGTLSRPEDDPTTDPLFFESMRWVRANYGAVWGICTGRSLPQLLEGLRESQFEALPDFVVVREREIFFPGQYGRWMADENWNERCHRDHHRLFRKCRRHLRQVKRLVEESSGASWVEEERDPAGIVAGDEIEMGEIVELFDSMRWPRLLSYERNGIYLRFSHASYNKGSALQELARRWGIGAQQTLAVGDNLNDLSLFQQEVCGACGCPSNAVPEVVERVEKMGGRVALRPASRGVIEILRHFFDPEG